MHQQLWLRQTPSVFGITTHFEANKKHCTSSRKRSRIVLRRPLLFFFFCTPSLPHVLPPPPHLPPPSATSFPVSRSPRAIQSYREIDCHQRVSEGGSDMCRGPWRHVRNRHNGACQFHVTHRVKVAVGGVVFAFISLNGESPAKSCPQFKADSVPTRTDP